jgi:hypothetical protein
MSAPPKTTVTWQGLSGLVGQNGPGGSGVCSLKYTPGGGNHGLALRFALPDEVTGVSATSLLERLGHPAGQSPEKTLLAHIEARAAALPLPDGCVVVEKVPGAATPWPDLLSVLAVLTKCSEAVWLRAKKPSLTSLTRRRAATLLVPPMFAHRILGKQP